MWPLAPKQGQAAEPQRTEPLAVEASATASEAPAAAAPAPASAPAAAAPALRRMMMLQRPVSAAEDGNAEESVHSDIFALATEWIDSHLDVDVWKPLPGTYVARAASAHDVPASGSGDAASDASPRRRPLAEVVIWNGRGALRKYRQPKVQPRDSIVQGKTASPPPGRLCINYLSARQHFCNPRSRFLPSRGTIPGSPTSYCANEATAQNC